MSDENNLNTSSQDNSDILSQLLQSTSNNQNQYLRSIDNSLKLLIRNSQGISAIDARNRSLGSHTSNAFNNRSVGANLFSPIQRGRSGAGGGNFISGFEKALFEGFVGSDFKDKLNGIFGQLADSMGISLRDLPNALGKAAGEKVFKYVQNTSLGSAVTQRISDVQNTILQRLTNNLNIPPAPKNQTPNTQNGNNLANANTVAATEVTRSPQPANQITPENTALTESELIINADVVNIKAQTVNIEKMSTQQAEEAAKSQIPQNSEGNNLSDVVSDAVSDVSIPDSVVGSITDSAASAEGVATSEMASSAMSADAALTGVMDAGMALAPELLVVAAAMAAVGAVTSTVGPIIKDALAILKKYSNSSARYEKSRQEQIKNEQARLAADVKTLVETPFKIMEEAANKWYDAWDNNLRVITGTQGYTKSDLQNLLGVFAEQLREQGLSDYISAADITNNLAEVLKSGLSGPVAESFAYLATELNAIVPTQDFFSYSDVYASIAANQVRLGKSQKEAISIANAELKNFASSIVYANRELAGGFSSGLKDASTIFAEAVQIAQAARSDNAQEIGSVLTAVSAVVGAIAPDLASGLVDTVYKAAVGGNSSELVAFRSLAGINASNTEFLKALASNPKQIFTTLFETLADRQNMAPDAYMEVAEGLSSIFGVSMDAFARVDFNYLAKVIGSINNDNQDFGENLRLLQKGQTTSTAEAMRMQEINRYMIEEGLSLVLDNEAARQIQEHMWDEQIARDLMDANYGVEIVGESKSLLSKIVSGVENLIDFFNPFSIFGKIGSFFSSHAEKNGHERDIENLLLAGDISKAGSIGAATAFANMTTRGTSLAITNTLLEKYGMSSSFESAHTASNFFGWLSSPVSSLWNTVTGTGSHKSPNDLRVTSLLTGRPLKEDPSVESVYSWGAVSKQVAAEMLAAANEANTSPSYTNAINTPESAEERAQKEAMSHIEEAVNSMEAFVEADTEHTMTYDDWVNNVKDQYNIADFNKALEQAGINETDLSNQYATLLNQEGKKIKEEREDKEEKFWEDLTYNSSIADELLAQIDTDVQDYSVEALDRFSTNNEQNTQQYNLTKEFSGDVHTHFSIANKLLESIEHYSESLYKKFTAFNKSWSEYFIEHKVYNNAFTHETYDKVVRKEREGSESAIYALADALTQNDVGLLLDPSLQTNALLAQILKVVSALLAQNNTGVTQTALPSTLTSLLLNSSNI